VEKVSLRKIKREREREMRTPCDKKKGKKKKEEEEEKVSGGQMHNMR
jgi:hypothetical protein